MEDKSPYVMIGLLVIFIIVTAAVLLIAMGKAS